MTLRIAFATTMLGSMETSVILCHNSDAFELKLLDGTSPRTHGFLDLPKGIWVFEGSMVRDTQCRYIGKMRAPTQRELSSFAKGECPWTRESEMETVQELLNGFKMPSTSEDWTAIYVAQSIAASIRQPNYAIAARALEIYMNVDPKEGETSALVHIFCDTAPPEMWVNAEAFIRKPHTLRTFLWALEDKIVGTDASFGVRPLQPLLENLQRETTDPNTLKTLGKILSWLPREEGT